MPVIVHLPTPYAAQAETMQALGFEQRESESDNCCWHFIAFGGGNGMPPYDLEIQWLPASAPTVEYAVAEIIKTAKQAGDQARIAKIQEALTPDRL